MHKISLCQQHHSFFFRIGSKYQHLRFKAGNTFGRKIQHCLLNYAEGTRFTQEKHARTKSSFINLLKPRAGGIHTVLSSLGDEITSILNVTLVYPGHSSPNFSDLLFGRVHKIVVRIESLKLGEGVVPSLETIRGKGGSLVVRNCLNELWIAKDKFISKIHSDAELNAETTQPTREPFSSLLSSNCCGFLSWVRRSGLWNIQL